SENSIESLKMNILMPENHSPSITLKYTINLSTIGTELSSIISKNESDWVPISGVWKYENGIYHQKSSVSYASSIIRSISGSDFIFGAKIKKTDPQYAGIIVKNQGMYTYWWHLRGDGETAQLAIIEDKPLESIAFKHAINEWNDLKVEINGDHIQGFINEKLMSDVISSELNESSDKKIGLTTYTGAADFSDIYFKELTDDKVYIKISYTLFPISLSNISVKPLLLEKYFQPSNTFSYSLVPLKAFENSAKYYDITDNNSNINDSIVLDSISADDMRPPDSIYFPTKQYNRTFAIRLITKGWDEEKQEWLFKEFISPEFTWDDIVKGRIIVDEPGNWIE
ncbi:MAG TPA: family 16 glycoside hydrolase, partial [Candidatus Methylomirabilis sp.]|nr:family 16 glycoside hydrolase [Candidatus Methylomirabilis sp.]